MSREQQQSAGVNSDAHDENGVDLTLIRWMLSLTPVERIEHIQQMADSLQELRDLNGLQEFG